MDLDTSKTKDFYCDFVFSGKIKVTKVRETDNVLAFYHTKPSWTTHIVIVTKKHISSLLELENIDLIKEIFEIAKDIIKEKCLDKNNFKIITNGGKFQDSKHLHFHLVSGKPLGK
jgi:histidine triad (HIT) family protein